MGQRAFSRLVSTAWPLSSGPNFNRPPGIRGGLLKGGSMYDLKLAGLDFNSTTVTAEALSEKGKAFLVDRFGHGCLSVTIKKSYLGKLAAAMDAEGLKHR